MSFSFLGKLRKEELVNLVIELGEQVPLDAKVVGLKNAIIQSPNYEEAFVKEWVNSVLSDRVERERVREEREEKQREREHELKMRELELGSAGTGKDAEPGVSSPGVGRDRSGNTFLGYLSALKGVIHDPPERAEEWPFFFHHAERMFRLFEVPEQYQGKIILNSLRGYAKGLNTMLSDEDIDNYEMIKKFVLKEQRITPIQYKRNFDLCNKSPRETYSQYASRVETALELYLKSREVKDFDQLKELIVADKIKDTLPTHVRSHVVLRESEDWLPVSDLVGTIDNFLASVSKNPNGSPHQNYNNRFNDYHQDAKQDNFGKKRMPFQNRPFPGKNFNEEKPFQGKNFGEEKKPFPDNRNGEQQNTGASSKKPLKCFACQEEGHIKRFCPKGTTTVAQIAKTETNDSEKKGLNVVSIQLNRASFDWEGPSEEADGELLRIDLGVGGHRCSGIVDSGAEITVLRESIIPDELLESSGRIMLRPAIGGPVEAKLMTIPLSLWTEEEDISLFVQMEVAVFEWLHEEALITSLVHKFLKEQTVLGGK